MYLSYTQCNFPLSSVKFRNRCCPNICGSIQKKSHKMQHLARSHIVMDGHKHNFVQSNQYFLPSWKTGIDLWLNIIQKLKFLA